VSEHVEFTIDGKQVSVPKGTTILEAAKHVGIEIPVLCYFEHTTANGLCRLCAVEMEGARVLQAACVAEANEGANVQTRSADVERARRTILEMLASTVDLSESLELQTMLEDYGADPSRFSGGAKRQSPLMDDNPVYVRDYSQCVMCWRCVQVCAEDAQYTFAINISGRGFQSRIGTFFEKTIPETTCVYCGQCVGVCPTGALKSKREHLLEQGLTVQEIFEMKRNQ
jgi:NADH dehydrogenase/NADH:ubiquinone oxidoreductase subunit G